MMPEFTGKLPGASRLRGEATMINVSAAKVVRANDLLIYEC